MAGKNQIPHHIFPSAPVLRTIPLPEVPPWTDMERVGEQADGDRNHSYHRELPRLAVNQTLRSPTFHWNVRAYTLPHIPHPHWVHQSAFDKVGAQSYPGRTLLFVPTALSDRPWTVTIHPPPGYPCLTVGCVLRTIGGELHQEAIVPDGDPNYARVWDAWKCRCRLYRGGRDSLRKVDYYSVDDPLRCELYFRGLSPTQFQGQTVWLVNLAS
ncbi:hypothetical protein C8Q80DRAFT_346884 [Daedaleopsis nitida]|nr:hypothetical protein C8Q80DRAFT_346884 [Daedaleopsis nitida]